VSSIGGLAKLVGVGKLVELPNLGLPGGTVEG